MKAGNTALARKKESAWSCILPKIPRVTMQEQRETPGGESVVQKTNDLQSETWWSKASVWKGTLEHIAST